MYRTVMAWFVLRDGARESHGGRAHHILQPRGHNGGRARSWPEYTRCTKRTCPIRSIWPFRTRSTATAWRSTPSTAYLPCRWAGCPPRSYSGTDRSACQQYAYEHGMDLPEIDQWTWPCCSHVPTTHRSVPGSATFRRGMDVGLEPGVPRRRALTLRRVLPSAQGQQAQRGQRLQSRRLVGDPATGGPIGEVVQGSSAPPAVPIRLWSAATSALW